MPFSFLSARNLAIPFLLLVCFLSTAAAEDPAPTTTQPTVELRVLPILDGPPGRFQLMFINRSNSDVSFTGILHNDNRLAVTRPSGRTDRIIFYGGPDRDDVTIAPGEMRVWEVNVLEHLERANIQETGTYTLKWEFFKDSWYSSEVAVARVKEE